MLEDRLTIVGQDYDGEPGDSRAGRDYFKRRFARLAQKANAKEREIYIQLVTLILSLPIALTSSSITTATDTAMLRVVMAAVEGQFLLFIPRLVR
jgi:guanine nucleotide-binding protein subunit alpha, other